MEAVLKHQMGAKMSTTVNEAPPAPSVIRHILYHGYVNLDFNPKSTKYRYTVTDRDLNERNVPVRGVTSVLDDIINKKELMTWALNMSNQAVFGAKFNPQTTEYEHDWNEALIKPGVDYTDEELSEIMKEGSRQWTIRSDKGKDVGSMVHSMIEKFLRDRIEGTMPNFSEIHDVYASVVEEASDADELSEEFYQNTLDALKAFTAFVEWWESGETKRVLQSEKVIYSRSMKYAGTFDLLADIGGKLYLLDVKTTNVSKKAPMGIYPEMFLQLGGYSYALREETGDEVYDCGIIRVGKDGRLFIATARDLGTDRDQCERAFAFAIRLHDWLDKVRPFLSDAHMSSHLNPPQNQVGAVEATNV